MNKKDLEFQLKIYDELKQYQEHFIQKVDPKPVDVMTGNIYFGAEHLTVRVGDLSDRTKQIIKQLVLSEMESCLYGTNETIECIKQDIQKLN